MKAGSAEACGLETFFSGEKKKKKSGHVVVFSRLRRLSQIMALSNVKPLYHPYKMCFWI